MYVHQQDSTHKLTGHFVRSSRWEDSPRPPWYRVDHCCMSITMWPRFAVFVVIFQKWVISSSTSSTLAVK